jgi:hypothetical protein
MASFQPAFSAVWEKVAKLCSAFQTRFGAINANAIASATMARPPRSASLARLLLHASIATQSRK